MSYKTCPHEPSIHQLTPNPNSDQLVLVEQLKEMIITSGHCTSWVDDVTIMRFLIARNFDVKKSYDLLITALKWRKLRSVDSILDDRAKWEPHMAAEVETGKIYLPGMDVHGRPVVIFDNTVQNTNNVDKQMEFLAWSLEFAIRLMPPAVSDKYVVFMHLNSFSIFNCPPLKATRETISILCSCFPERLGHCICYQPPTYFITFYNTIKSFIDIKTRKKVVFISGDVSDGSPNDVTMRMIIGDDWKKLTGAEQKVYKKNCSPGFQFDAYWPSILARYDAFIAGKHAVASDNNDKHGNSDDNLQPVIATTVDDTIKEMKHVENVSARVSNTHWFVELLPTPAVIVVIAAIILSWIMYQL